jgi:hypothetical protein
MRPWNCELAPFTVEAGRARTTGHGAGPVTADPAPGGGASMNTVLELRAVSKTFLDGADEVHAL